MGSRPTTALALVIVLGLFGTASPVWAQRTTATFAGIVVDTSGGVLPGADVQLANEETRVVEQQVSSPTGEFLFNYVPVGSYTLTISISGFKTYKTTGIPLGAAQNVRRTYPLELGEVAENVTVVSSAPLVNAISAEQRVNLERLEINTLPTANRNISNILNIATGVTMQEQSRAVRLRLNGLGGTSTSITANGTEASGNNGTRQLSQYDGISKIDVMSIEAIGEVQIVKGVLPAEYAYAMGGNLNLITKSGTNNWHGSLFDRYEGSALSAKPQTLTTKPDSVWKQFGGSWGGPIRHDRAFLFAAYEGYRQRTSVPINANVPTQRLRDLAVAALPFPETKLFLDAYPLPTQPVTATALSGVFIGPGVKNDSDDHLDIRTDIRVRGGNLSGTFAAGHPFLEQASVLPGVLRTYKTRSRRASTSYALARGHWSSETRFGVNYNWLSRTDGFFNVVDPNKPATLSGQRGIAPFTLPGLSAPPDESHVRGLIPAYTFEQQFAIVTAKHSFKLGGIYSRPGGGRINTQSPTVSFQTLDDLLVNNPSQINYFLGSPESTWKVTNFGFFGQDDWRVNNKLVINLGLRYDFFGRYRVEGVDPNVPTGILNLDGLLDDKFNFGPPRDPERPIENDGGINLGPRAGFAYSVDSKSHSVVRGGWGLLFQPLDTQLMEANIGPHDMPQRKTVSRQEASALGLKWPVYNEEMIHLLLTQPSLPQVGGLFDPHIQSPYAMVFSLGVERTLGSAMVLETAYIGSRGYKFALGRTYNPVDRVTGLRPNPALGQGTYIDDSQRTTYHSWQTSVRRRLANHVMFNANYTWAKALATGGGDTSASFLGETTNVQEFFNIDADRGPAIGDVTHAFIGSAIYEIGNDTASSSFGRHLLVDWQIAAIFRASTGLPLTVTQTSALTGSRPDVVDYANAVNPDCCGVGQLQYLNRSAFQLVPVNPVSQATIRPGNAGNGAFRGPGYQNVDLSLAKSIPLGKGRKFDVRADLVNALNHTNWRTVQTNLSASNFGQVTETMGARVIQIQGRYSF